MRLFFLIAIFGGLSAQASLYDTVVRRDRPALYKTLPGTALMPNGDGAQTFDGATQYVEVPSNANLSVHAGKALTLEAWIRPDTLQFSADEGDGYVHWAGKGEAGQHEYALRMYSKTNSAGRPSRISGYAFNLDGGLGSGSYFQDVVHVGEWIYVVVVIDYRSAPGAVAIYKNGVLRKTTSLAQFGVTPQPGNAPLRIGTRDLRSFFKGAIGKFAVYQKALSESQLRAHYAHMKP